MKTDMSLIRTGVKSQSGVSAGSAFHKPSRGHTAATALLYKQCNEDKASKNILL
jgi:hypothetical protein